jgi:uncharacterized protein (DUF885 family)
MIQIARLVPALLLLGLPMFASPSSTTQASQPIPPATPTPSPLLAALCDEYWQGLMRADPTWATSLGDRRYDDRLSDNSPAGYAAERQRRQDVLARAKAIDPSTLGPADRVTRRLLIEECETWIATEACRFEEWVVDPMGGPQTDFLNLPELTPLRTKAEADAYVKRVRAMAFFLDQHIANLQRGLATGRTATVDAVNKTLAQLDRLAELPVSDWTFFEPLRTPGAIGSKEDVARTEEAIAAAIKDEVQPAFERYRNFLRSQVLPAARPQAKAGLVALPGGRECYQPAIRNHTSLDLTPEELHALGKSEIARIRKEPKKSAS